MKNPAEGTHARGNAPEITIDALTRIMRRNAPILHFSSEEEYFTYNVPDYLEVVDLHDSANHHLVAKAPLTPKDLPSDEASSKTYLSIPDDRRGIEKGDRAKTEIYVHVVGWEADGKTGFDFQYFFFYAYNGPGTLGVELIGVGSVEIGIPAGAHQGDWESIIVRTDADGRVIAVYCNQHGSGAWYLPQEMTWSDDGHPHIYVGKFGHPSYVRVGRFYNASYYLPELDVAFHLVNRTSDGPRLTTTGIVNLVATTNVPGAQVASPWWLGYRGRYGLVVFTAQGKQRFEDALAAEIAHVIPVPAIAREIAAAITGKLYSALEEILPDGPEAPIAKGWWGKPIPDGPWQRESYWWSGDARIASLPGGIDPKSSFGPSMAALGGDVHMVYRGASSDTLYSAWRSPDGWHGNTPIEIAGQTLKSDSTPGLARYRDAICMIYKGHASTTLYGAWLENGIWRGNDPLVTSAGNPESSGSPALAEFHGSLYAVYKGRKSDTVYCARFDGRSWHGNAPVADATTREPVRSKNTVALAVYDGLLHLVYVEAGSGELCLARFDGESWELDGPVRVDGRKLTSANAPAAAVVDGSLRIFFLVRSLLLSESDIFWVAYDAASRAWRGNESIGQGASIRPRTDHQVGVAAVADGLVMVYKGASSSDFYQAEYLRHA